MDSGSSAWKLLSFQDAVTCSHVSGESNGFPGKQDDAMGAVLIRVPLMVSFRADHSCVDGQDGSDGVILQEGLARTCWIDMARMILMSGSAIVAVCCLW